MTDVLGIDATKKALVVEALRNERCKNWSYLMIRAFGAGVDVANVSDAQTLTEAEWDRRTKDGSIVSETWLYDILRQVADPFAGSRQKGDKTAYDLAKQAQDNLDSDYNSVLTHGVRGTETVDGLGPSSKEDFEAGYNKTNEQALEAVAASAVDHISGVIDGFGPHTKLVVETDNSLNVSLGGKYFEEVIASDGTVVARQEKTVADATVAELVSLLDFYDPEED